MNSGLQPQLELRLRQLIEELGLPLKRLPEIFELSAFETLQWWSGNLDFTPNEKHLLKLSNSLGINDSDLFRGSYDLKLAKERVHGKLGSLPERYLKNQNSFVRTSEHIYKYLKLTRGEVFTNQVYSELNVDPRIYSQPELSINLTFFGDLLNKLNEKGLQPFELDTLAGVIFLSIKDRPLGKVFSDSECYQDVYTTLVKNYGYFDNNFEVKSKVLGRKCSITATMSLEGHSDLQNAPETIHRLLRYREICLTWMPFLAGKTPLFPSTEINIKNDLVQVHYELRLPDHSKLHLLPN